MTWPGLIQPPRLQHSDTETGQQRNASRLELVFDLAFVLVVAELAVELRDNLTLQLNLTRPDSPETPPNLTWLDPTEP